MEIKTRSGGILIRDNKILIVKGVTHKELWTPGGKHLKNESDEECLRRELLEELGVNLLSCIFYKEYTGKSFYHEYLVKSRLYFITIEGTPKPRMEIEKILWLSKDDIEKNAYFLIPLVKKLLRDLIVQGYLK